MHQIRFRLGFGLDLAGDLTASSRPPSRIQGVLLLREERGKERGGRKGGDGGKRGRRGGGGGGLLHGYWGSCTAVCHTRSSALVPIESAHAASNSNFELSRTAL